MVSYEWIRGSVPIGVQIKQVYGIVFDHQGMVLLRVDNEVYKLTGGKPEETDSDFEDTLKREYLEELNVELEDVHYLGYLKVIEDDKVYAQVRMIGKIKHIGELRADTDSGKVYKRFMAKQENVKLYLKYPDVAGTKLVDDAIKMANEVFDFKENQNEQKEYFI